VRERGRGGGEKERARERERERERERKRIDFRYSDSGYSLYLKQIVFWESSSSCQSERNAAVCGLAVDEQSLTSLLGIFFQDQLLLL
jgi:hypothetical protein